MSGYIIYAFNEITQADEVYDIDDIEVTVDTLLRSIIKTKFKEVWFGDTLLSKHRKDMLADIGLGPECKVIIKKRQYTDKEEKFIIKTYGEKALIAYKKIFNEEDIETNSYYISKRYFGYYTNTKLLVDDFIEMYEGTLPNGFKNMDNKPNEELILNEFIEQDNYYFWWL